MEKENKLEKESVSFPVGVFMGMLTEFWAGDVGPGASYIDYILLGGITFPFTDSLTYEMSFAEGMESSSKGALSVLTGATIAKGLKYYFSQ